MNVLVINCGSSSVKYRLLDPESGNVLLSGRIERVGDTPTSQSTHQQAIAQIVTQSASLQVDAVGHRVVHGGERFVQATLIDPSVCDEISQRVQDAPLHNPYNLLGIQQAREAWPDVPHVAVFDTAFHARLPRRASSYAIDAEIAARFKVRRFGFHGTSHQYVARVAAENLGARVDQLRIVTLHLGNGASACAVEFGVSTETSMGMTPLEGLVMGTRAGDIDAGALLTLMRDGDYTAKQLDNLLNRHSGLAGLSGISHDLREIEQAAADGHDGARLAINVFAHRVRKYIGSYAAVMGGIDAVVFTGGIGENSATMRRRVLQRFEYLGLRLDETANLEAVVGDENTSAIISEPHSRVAAVVVRTDEELMIARQTRVIAAKRHLREQKKTIPIAVSARHMHLTDATFKQLFGEDATPTHYKDISQPGQYACAEKVNLIGPRNRIDGVRLLGPLRSVDQIEIARTDEFRLGVDAPIRDSGKVEGSAPIVLEGPAGTVQLKEGLICARRHIHMTTADARYFSVSDGDIVEVAVSGGPRDLSFGDVLVRVSDKYLLEMHIDTDEGNACEIENDATGELVYRAAVPKARLRSAHKLIDF